MTLKRASNQALMLGVAVIILGLVCCLFAIAIHILYGDFLNSLLQKEPNSQTVAFLVERLKGALFSLVPALGLGLIGSGMTTIIYCRKVNNALRNHDDLPAKP